MYMQLPLGDPKTCLPGSTCLQTLTLFPTLMPSDDPQTSCSMPEYVLVCVCACVFSPQGFFAMFHVIIQVNKHEQWKRRKWVKDGVLNRKYCQRFRRLLTLPVKPLSHIHSKPHVLGFRFTLKGLFVWVTVRDSKCLIIGYITSFTLFYIV